jgi:CheY-like chemotaxis protein
MNKNHPVTIILIEDDPGHARLIEKNLRRTGVRNDIVVLDDGHKAIEYLFNEGESSRRDHVSHLLILLDLNLPVISGYEVLKIIKNDIRTRHIPVVVLTSTDNPHEIARCYELGCNVYVTKPVEYDQFAEAIRKLGLFLEIVKVPEESVNVSGGPGLPV